MILSLFSSLTFIYSLYNGVASGYIITVTFVKGVAIAFVSIIISLIALQAILYLRSSTRLISFYFSLLVSFTLTMLLLISSFNDLSFMPTLSPFTVPLILSISAEILSVAIISREIEMRLVRILVLIVALLIILYVGNQLIVSFNRPGMGLIFDSTEAVFIALGKYTPPLTQYGIVIFSTHFYVLLSLQSFAIFSALSIIIAENYAQIIRYLTRRSGSGSKLITIAYGLTGVFSCQCESYISFLPALTILLLNYIILPLLLLSVLLLLGTYFLVTRRYTRGLKVRFLERSFYNKRKTITLLLSALLFIGSPIFTVLVVYLHLITNALFFFMSGMVMILNGYAFMLALSSIFEMSLRKLRGRVAIIAIATTIAFVWYYPGVAILALRDPGFFVLMNLTMFASGLLYGTVYISYDTRWRDVLNEYISTIYGIFALVLFYLLVTLQHRIWPFFSLESQVNYTLISWALMLPVMWIFTQLSLYAARNGPPRKMTIRPIVN